MTGLRPTLRLDKWLWHARIVKSRALAVKLIEGTGIRVHGNRVVKPGYGIREGDVLTFSLGERVLVLRVLALGARRGPAPEARALYEDLSPPAPPEDKSLPRPVAGGRPDKHTRRRFAAPPSQTLD